MLPVCVYVWLRDHWLRTGDPEDVKACICLVKIDGQKKWPAHIPLMWDFRHCLWAHWIFQWAVVTSQNKRIIARGRYRQAAWGSFRKGRRWCQYFAESCWPSLVHVSDASLKWLISLSWQISPLLKPMVMIPTLCKSFIITLKTRGNNAGVQWTKLIPGLILEFSSMALLWLCSKDAALHENN